MEKVSILEFRRNAEAIIRKVSRGKRLILTYRGKPVMRLEPIADVEIDSNDPFYSLGRLAAPAGSLSNREIDSIVYEE
ncbi:MAG TPA: type II toxin-antitoxin system prevent-host-death family antitoxin [Candidatus Obscuribacterales bacterium]